jgi:hypothetical protein
MNVNKFKIGDKVKVIDNIEVETKIYGDIYFVSDMEQYKSKTLTIVDIAKDWVGDEFYRIKEDDQRWFWDDTMIELVEKSIKLGDKVKCINSSNCGLIYEDRIYTVSLISSELDAIKLEEIDIDYYYCIEDFELVDDYEGKTTNCLDVILDKLGIELEEEFEVKTLYGNNWEKFKMKENGLCYSNGGRDSVEFANLLTGQTEYRKIKPIPQPSAEEQKVLDAAKVLGYNWVSKDENGKCFFYVIKPTKILDMWSSANGNHSESMFDFKFLNWKDQNPYEIK